MSFDLYLQGFSDAHADRSESVGRILDPLLDAQRHNVLTKDGSAAVHGAEENPLTGLMFTHVVGDLAWDVIFEVAVAGHWVVMPVGGPICLVRPELADSVPADLQDLAVVVVHSGLELRAAATSFE